MSALSHASAASSAALGLVLALCSTTIARADQKEVLVDSGVAPALAGYRVRACQAEAAQALRKQRSHPVEALRFATVEALPVVSTRVPSVQGQGAYRGAGAASSTPFSYRCTFNPKTGMVSGVVLREAPALLRSDAAQANWNPDLSRLSPQDCASAVALNLQNQYPRVGAIRINAEALQLKPGEQGRALLQGSGGVERALGMSAVPFSYSCDVDLKSGRVLGVKTSS